MDNGDLPANYNPDQSMLNGGTDASIIKVMGGGGVEGEGGVEGGGGAPNGYNETISLLEGGIDVPIQKVFGGGSSDDTSPDIQIISHYDSVDAQQFNNFLTNLKTGTKLNSIIKKFQDTLRTIDDKNKVLHYVKKNTIIETSALNSTNSINIVQIKIIPLSTKKIIVLPPLHNDKPESLFFSQIQYLIQNNYMNIDFIIARNIIIISLQSFPQNTNQTLQFLYYKMKISNYDSYFVVDNPFKLLYPKDNGILFTTKEQQYITLPQDNDVLPTEFDSIIEQNIKSMKYRGKKDSNISTFDIIYGGDLDPTESLQNYSFSLYNHIAVITLVEEDFKTINIDIEGKFYRIRIPLHDNDITVQQWHKNKFTKDEMKLIEDFHLDEIKDFDVPKFLFYLSYFKCYNDTSLLTRKECSVFKSYLSQLYNYHLVEKNTKESINIGFIIISGALDTGGNKLIITYKENNSNEEKSVEIDKKYKDYIERNELTNKDLIDAVKEAIV